MEKMNSSILNTSTDSTMKLTSMLYKRRPPTPTKTNRKFELGELESESSASKSSRLNADVQREEMALKDELLRIFQREKETMEQHYINKIQELLRSFKGKKIEWEEMVKAERQDLESQFETERSEMHANFTQEIARLTKSFQEEKLELERSYENKLRDKDLSFEREKKDLQERWTDQLSLVKKQCQSEHEATLSLEMKSAADKHNIECQSLEAKNNNIRNDLEKNFERELSKLDTRHHKECFDMEKKFEEEKNKIDREWQRKIETIEDALRKETNRHAEIERASAYEKSNLQAVNMMLKEEIGRLKDEIDRLRKVSLPSPEVKIIEKTTEAPLPRFNSRSDLPPSLRDDFDRILNEYKENLKDKFQRDKSELEEKLEAEKERLTEKILRQKEELEKRMSEEKFRMERDLDRSRDDIEKEIERRLRTKQLSDSLATQQQRFDEVTRRLEEEEKSRRDAMLEQDRRKYDAVIQELTRENEGLKAKVHVLKDNNNLLKNLKEEGQEEIERLRRAVEELKVIVEAKRDTDRTCVHTPAEFMMSMLHDKEPVSQKSNLDELNSERRKLEELRNDLEKQERDIRERRTVEDAAKIAVDRSTEKYDNLLSEKRQLQMALKSLEQRVAAMQDDFLRMRYNNSNHNSQPQLSAPLPPPPAPQPPTQQVVTQPQPIIVQPQYIPPPQPERMSSPSYPPVHHHYPMYIPHPQPQPQPQPPPQPPPQQQIIQSPNSDQKDKIYKLKSAKDRLTRQVQELQDELKDANHENNLLQKQCREFERQVEKLGDALEREREISNNLRDLVDDEKSKFSSLKEECEREKQNVIRIRNESDDMRMKLQREIQELQTKLHHAGQTLAAVRQQASNDITQPLVAPFPQPNDGTVGFVALPPPMAPMASIMAANAARRRQSVRSALNTSRDSFGAFERAQEKQETFSKEELWKLRALEEEKLKLQSQLNDAKGALDAYAGKLDSQLVSLQSKVDESNNLTKELSEENQTLNKAVQALGFEQTNQARQNFHLRNQKMQLQKLIERLTAMNLQPPPPY